MIFNGTSAADFLFGTRFYDLLFGGAGNDTLQAGDGHDEIYAEDGDDTIFGGAGNDYIVGGSGRDIINGGQGADLIDYSDEGGLAGITVNLLSGTATDTYGHMDLLFDIENIRGTHSADSITGNQGENRLEGLGGNDVLDGGDGSDWADYIRNTVFGATTGVVVNLGTGTASDGFGGTDTLLNIENVYGSTLDDTITGDAEANHLDGKDGNDIINGGGGDDQLAGGAGDDVLNGGAGIDYIDYSIEGGTNGVFVDLRKGFAFDTFGDRDELTSIEQVRGTDQDDTIIGDAEDNGLVGRDGDDLLEGKGGDDALYGDEGDDRLFGNQGDDTLIGGEGSDQFEGGSGFDRVDYMAEGGTLGIHVDLGAGFGTDSYGHTDYFQGIERVDGTNEADTISGDAANNTLVGHGGTDVLSGRDGNDRLEGGDGSDFLFGGNGDDKLVGGAGSDILIGGAGQDTFDFSVGDGVDTIVDFNILEDRIALSGNAEFVETILAQAQATGTEGDGYTRLDISTGDGQSYQIILQGVDERDLTADMFDLF